MYTIIKLYCLYKLTIILLVDNIYRSITYTIHDILCYVYWYYILNIHYIIYRHYISHTKDIIYAYYTISCIILVHIYCTICIYIPKYCKVQHSKRYYRSHTTRDHKGLYIRIIIWCIYSRCVYIYWVIWKSRFKILVYIFHISVLVSSKINQPQLRHC